MGSGRLVKLTTAMQNDPYSEDPVRRDDAAEGRSRPSALRFGAKPALLALGWICVGLGTVGLVVPGLPTTIFLIIALWAFSKSSERFHAWLYDHPRFGPPLRAWSEHGVVPVRAKILAVVFMTASWLIVTLWVAESWIAPAIMGAVLLTVAAFILTRPSTASR